MCGSAVKDDDIGGSWFSGEGCAVRRARLFVSVPEQVFRVGVCRPDRYVTSRRGGLPAM
jgi:hypothetical protein